MKNASLSRLEKVYNLSFIGQMRVLFGDKCCDDILFSLNAVFITHGHQDHYQGIFTVIKKRREIFQERGISKILKFF